MDVVNIYRSRRFLRERPIHVNLFDRPRIVVDLLCLEPEQEESRRGFDRSDSLLVMIEGEARLRAGPQIESLQAMDAALVPPGQEYRLTNTGPGQVTAVVILTPKPTRADEVRIPGDDRRPYRPAQRREATPAADEGEHRGRRPRESATRPSAARTGTTARRPKRDEGEGPVWYPKPRPARRARGAPASTRATGPAKRTQATRGKPAPARAKGGKKTGAARRASRGQGPLTGHRGPGRSGPRT